MKKIKDAFVFFLFFAVFPWASYAQNSAYAEHYNNGASLYNQGRYYEAGAHFRSAQEIASSEHNWAAAIYWVILSELAYSDYGSALLDMAELERKAPSSIFNRDMAYHKGRIYFNQGYFENALSQFKRYIDSVLETTSEAKDRKAAAFFWMGESLFAMGQFDEAEKFYVHVLDGYPESPKREISSYRVDLIKQKKIEAELLALLQWSHEESLRTSEEYQRRIRTYEYTLNQYQRRITELTRGESVFQDSGADNNYDYYERNYTSDVSMPEDFTANSTAYNNSLYSEEYNRYLLDRAVRLGVELEELIRKYETGAVW